jgi:hypothetical protein
MKTATDFKPDQPRRTSLETAIHNSFTLWEHDKGDLGREGHAFAKALWEAAFKAGVDWAQKEAR